MDKSLVRIMYIMLNNVLGQMPLLDRVFASALMALEGNLGLRL